MNKKQLISIIRTEVLLAKSSPERKGYIAGLEEAINIIEGFSDESQKPVVPQFVADWIEYCKRHNFTLFGCLDPVGGFDVLAAEDFEGDVRKCIRWCRSASDKVAHAWLDGYEIEEEKRYTVVMKYTKQPLYYNAVSKKMFFSMGELVTSFTRKELEEAGFGWIFSCEGIEIEEVE